MDYLVRDPVIVNGVRRRRGDVLTGDDAAAVEASTSIRARCVPHRYNEQMKTQTAPAKPAPSSSSASKSAGKE